MCPISLMTYHLFLLNSDFMSQRNPAAAAAALKEFISCKSLTWLDLCHTIRLMKPIEWTRQSVNSNPSEVHIFVFWILNESMSIERHTLILFNRENCKDPTRNTTAYWNYYGKLYTMAKEDGVLIRNWSDDSELFDLMKIESKSEKISPPSSPNFERSFLKS